MATKRMGDKLTWESGAAGTGASVRKLLGRLRGDVAVSRVKASADVATVDRYVVEVPGAGNKLSTFYAPHVRVFDNKLARAAKTKAAEKTSTKPGKR